MSLFVGNISKNVDFKDLDKSFSYYGSCKINKRGSYAFIEFKNEADAEDAKESLQGKNLGGLHINIEWSRRSGRFDPREARRRNMKGRKRSHDSPGSGRKKKKTSHKSHSRSRSHSRKRERSSPRYSEEKSLSISSRSRSKNSKEKKRTKKSKSSSSVSIEKKKLEKVKENIARTMMEEKMAPVQRRRKNWSRGRLPRPEEMINY